LCAATVFDFSPCTAKGLQSGIIVLCAAMTVFLNTAWKNDVEMGLRMRKDFPDHPAGYMYTAMRYLTGDCTTWRWENLKKAFRWGWKIPGCFL